MTGISKIAVFLDYLQPFTLFWKNLSKKTETGENIMKMDDLLIFTMLEKLKKTHRNVAVRTDAYAVQKN